MTWSRGQRFDRAVMAMAVVSLLWHGFVAVQQTWYIDDWVYLDGVQTMGFWEYLLQDYNRHVMPGQFLLVWLMTKSLPLVYLPAAVLVAVAWFASVLVWGRALRELFGPRLRMLLPLAVVAGSPVLLGPTAFFASALQVLPLLLLMGLAVLYAGRVGAGGPGARRAQWQLLATYAVALLLWQKALVLVIPVVAVIWFVGGFAVRRHLRLVLSAAALSVAYLVVYLLLRDDAAADYAVWSDAGEQPWPERLGRMAVYAAGVFRDLAIPAVYGGPWGSIPIVNDVYHWPARVPVLVLAVVTLVAFVGLSLARRRGWVPLTMVASYSVLAVLLIMFSIKYDVLGPFALYEDRYFADVVPVLALAAAMLMSPTRVEAEDATPVWRTRSPWRAGRAATAVWGVAGVAIATSLVVANLQHWQRIGPNPAKAWVDNLRADALDAGTARVRDAVPPLRVQDADYYPETALVSRMLGSLPHDLTFDGPGQPLLTVAADGHLVPTEVTEAVVSRPGPQPDCGYLLKEGTPQDVALSGRLFPNEWGVQVDLFSGEGGTLEVVVDGEAQRARVPAGASTVQLVHAGAVTTVTASMVEPTRTACVTALRAGEMHAAP